jgi:TctA family transporter
MAVSDTILVWIIAYVLIFFIACKSQNEGMRIFGWIAFALNGLVGMAIVDEVVMILPAGVTVIIGIVKLYNIFTGTEDIKDRRSWLTT